MCFSNFRVNIRTQVKIISKFTQASFLLKPENRKLFGKSPRNQSDFLQLYKKNYSLTDYNYVKDKYEVSVKKLPVSDDFLSD